MTKKLTTEEEIVLALWADTKGRSRQLTFRLLAERWSRRKMNNIAKELITKGLMTPIVVKGQHTVRLTPQGSQYFKDNKKRLRKLLYDYEII